MSKYKSCFRSLILNIKVQLCQEKGLKILYLLKLLYLWPDIACTRFKKYKRALARWLSWLEHHPYTKRSQFDSWSGHIPTLRVWFLFWVRIRGIQWCFSLTSMCVFLFLSFFLSLKSINISLGEDLKNKRCKKVCLKWKFPTPAPQPPTLLAQRQSPFLVYSFKL